MKGAAPVPLSLEDLMKKVNAIAGERSVDDPPVRRLHGRSILALPLERGAIDEVVGVLVAGGKVTLFQRDQQDHVLTNDNDATVPTTGVELCPEVLRDVASDVLAPRL